MKMPYFLSRSLFLAIALALVVNAQPEASSETTITTTTAATTTSSTSTTTSSTQQISKDSENQDALEVSLSNDHGKETVTTEHSQYNLQPALHDLGAIWPVPGVSRTHIDGSFGPCILAAESRYHFSRGVKIAAAAGVPVRSILPGKVHTVKQDEKKGLVVVVEHKLDEKEVGFGIPMHGKNRTTLYTLYMHLSRVAKSYDPEIVPGGLKGVMGRAVGKGEIVGFVGDTGSMTTKNSLYFETRVGSACTLEEQNAGENGCANVGYDPAVHPLGLLAVPPEGSGLRVVTEAMASAKDEAVVSITASAVYPVANRFQLHVKRADSWDETISVLDLSMRDGFNASTAAALDMPDVTEPYINPMPFDSSADEWKVEYRIPPSYATKVEGDEWELKVIDVFGNEFTAEVASIDLDWV